MRTSIYTLAALLLPAIAFAGAPIDSARVTVGVPAYVHHPDDRPGAQDWNEGWFKNEGVLVDATWPIYTLGDATRLRAGVTAGGFDNSINHTSIFAGGVLEVETYATPRWAFSLGTYAGGITGYDYDVSPAIAPYVGTSYAITDGIELGARGFWLPAKTFAGSDVAPSDAYVAAVTIGTRF